ncbi:MAG: hypothetical protein ACK6D7_17650 [Acidobacteriota bacterium]
MLNPDPPIFELACVDLQARIAQARRDTLDEISHQQSAVPLEDSLGYMEPPDWFYPNRENLGHDLRRVATAAEAELVFRQDLKKESAQRTIAARSETSVTVAGQKRKPRVCRAGAPQRLAIRLSETALSYRSGATAGTSRWGSNKCIGLKCRRVHLLPASNCIPTKNPISR